MRFHKVVRYLGLMLLALSFLLSLLSSSLLLMTDASEGSSDKNPYRVLLVDTIGSYPTGETRSMLHVMDVDYEEIVLSESETEHTGVTKILDSVQANIDQKIVIVGVGSQARSALLASISAEQVVGVFLIAPELQAEDDLSLLGTNRPGFPVGIIAPDSALVRGLYERVSGEDTRLFAGSGTSGIISSSRFVSPDGRRVLSVWNVPEGIPLFSFLPGVTEELSVFLGTFVMSDGVLSQAGSSAANSFRSTVLLCVLVAFGGLLLFVSSVPALANRNGEEIQTQPDAFADDVMRARYKKKLLIVTGLSSLVITGISIVLVFIDRAFAIYPLLLWPAVYYANTTLLLPKRAQTIVDKKVRPERMIYAIITLLFFAVTMGSATLFYQHSILAVVHPIQALLSALLCIAIFVFVRRSILSGVLLSPRENIGSVYEADGRFYLISTRILLFLPSAIVLAGALLASDELLFVRVLLFTAGIGIAILLRNIYKLIAGTALFAALAMSVWIFLLLVF